MFNLFKLKNIYYSYYYKTQHRLELALIIVALLLAAFSFFVLLDITPIIPTRPVCISLICINLASVILLCSVIFYRIYPIIIAWRLRRSASRLHFRIIMLFSGIASLPALVVAIVAVVTFNMGLDRWFNNTTRDIVNSSINIANVYAAENLNSLVYNTRHLIKTLDNRDLLRKNLMEYKRLMTLQAVAYNMSAVFLLSSNGDIYVSSYLGNENSLPIPPKDLIQQAQQDKPFPFQPGKHNYFGVIVKLKNLKDTYLYVIRNVHQTVLQALRLTEYNTNRYKDMQNSVVPLQLAFAVLYLCLFLSLWLCAILTGLNMANRLVRPIRRLIGAADRVALGDLNLCLPVGKHDDMGQLSRTFNYMVGELRTQRDELLLAKDVIDERRRFTEAVLSGVSAGVIGVNANGYIIIVNRAFKRMFKLSTENIINCSIDELSNYVGSHAIRDIFYSVIQGKRSVYSSQFSVNNAGYLRVYNIQVTAEQSVKERHSWVITIDDITDLVEAHRSLAWADVAKRIAHEIKNPLTPIQLSAERIKRRYSRFINQDKDVFDKCLETIIRQVGNIGRMVNEFSAFARMPKPKMEILDIQAPLAEACFLVEVAVNNIKIERQFSSKPLLGSFDSRLIMQAFSNVIKNASEAIETDRKVNKEYPPGHILVRADTQDQNIIIEIIDNGRGWPVLDREKLLEPYVTTREKGTGLGLSIVRKIVEEHKGIMQLHNAPKEFYGGVGAMIKMIFPLKE